MAILASDLACGDLALPSGLAAEFSRLGLLACMNMDKLPPVVTLTSPRPGLLTNHNVPVLGRVTDSRSGVKIVQAQVDNGPLFNLDFDKRSGGFHFNTAFRLGGLADGGHTVRVRATDMAGNRSKFASVHFTLDSRAPGIVITSPTPGLMTNANVTVAGQVADNLSGVAALQAQIDSGAFFNIPFDAGGHYSFATHFALDGSADGDHTVRLRARDRAGNVSGLSPVSFHLGSCDLSLADWTAGETGGSAAGHGSAVIDNCTAVLREGDSFNVTLQHPFTVPQQPSALMFHIVPAFDTSSSHRIKDAFEAAFVTGDGTSLVHAYVPERAAFVNLSEGQQAALGGETSFDGQTVSLNLAGLAPGTTGTLILRLVNNDADTGTSVGISSVQMMSTSHMPPAGVTPAVAAARSTRSIDFDALSDVSASFTPDYARTSFDAATHVLHTELALRNTGQYLADAPLVVEVAHISARSVLVQGADGIAPDGNPYFDFSDLLAGRTLNPGAATQTHALSFFDPGRVPFHYDLIVLGQLNRPPVFTTQPKTEAIPGVAYSYPAAATDPDHDRLTFTLLAGPTGMQVDPASGKVTWSPQESDLGTHAVALRVDDGRGGTAEQDYTVTAIVAPPNRPPVFTSTPVVDANVNTAYTYQAAAQDPDGDALTFSIVSAPQGLSIDAHTGLVTWTPTASQLGNNRVMLKVDDGRGGTATQVYPIAVQQEPGNHPPVIVSSPVTTLPLRTSIGTTDPMISVPTGFTVTTTDVGTELDALELSTGGPYGTAVYAGTAGKILKINPTTGAVSTFASGLNFGSNRPSGLAFDNGAFGTGRLYLSQNDGSVSVIDPSGGVSLVSAGGSLFSSNDLVFGRPGSGFAQRLFVPNGEFPPPGTISSIDVRGSNTQFAASNQFGGGVPVGLAFAPAGSAFGGKLFASVDNGTVVAVDSAGVGTVVARGVGLGIDLDFGHAAFGDNLYVSDPNTQSILRVAPDGTVSRFATGFQFTISGFDADITFSPDGNTLYVANGSKLTIIQGPIGGYQYAVKAIDPDNDPLTYSLTAGPMGMKIDPASGLITWDGPGVRSGSSGPLPSNGLTLTTAGAAAGFTLTDFAKGFPTAQGPVGPLGIAFPTSGGVLVSDNAGNVRRIPTDTDGQNAANIAAAQNYGAGRAFDMAQSGGNLYMTQRDNGTVIQLNDDGTFRQTIVSGLSSPHGIVVNPVNGHLLVSSYNANNIYDVDPAAKTVSLLFHASFDGISITPDGTVLYGAAAPSGLDHVYGYSLVPGSIGSVVFDSGTVPGDPDGIALGVGTLAGKLFVNTNQGTVVQIDLRTRQQTTIASGGTRGDFVTIDPNDGSLLLTQSSNVVRLQPPAGASFAADFKVGVRVEDGRGGYDTQSYTLHVGDQPGEIHGTVFNDLNGDGVRQQDPDRLLGPIPYLSRADSPFDLAGLGTNIFLEDFEHIPNDAWNGQLTTPGATVTPRNTFLCLCGPITDSVDADDGMIDGSGVMGHSLFNGNGAEGITFTFDAAALGGLPTHAGIVWTDGAGTITFEAFGAQGESLGTVAGHHADGAINGTTAEDRFYGVVHKAGISAIKISNSAGGIEVDHLQYGRPGPATSDEPGLPGWTVYIDQNHNGQLDAGEPSTATDPDGNYTLPDIPPGTYDVAELGQPGWQQTAPAGRTNEVTLTAGQVVTGIDFGNVQKADIPANRPPKLTSAPPTTASVNQLYRYNPSAADPDGDRVTFDLVVSPDGMAINPISGTVVWQPTAAQVGTHDVILRVQDGNGGVDLQAFQVTVRANLALVITSTPPSPAAVGLPYRYAVRAQEAGSLPLTFRLDAAPAGMAIDAATGVITWTPAAGDTGTKHVVITADDGQGGLAQQAFDLLVVASAPNHLPVITSSPRQTIRLGGSYLYAFQATDPDGDPLTYHLDTAPAGMTIDPSGLVSWKPTADQFGTNVVVLRADDGRGGNAGQSFTVNVVSQQAADRPPAFVSKPPVAATVGLLYRYDTQAIDPEGDPLAWSLDAAPAGMSIDPQQGAIRWTPTADQVGPQQVAIRVRDGQGSIAVQGFTITVYGVDVPPVITSPPPTQAAVAASYSYPVQASDADADPLTFSLLAAPAGMTIDASSGVITWVPTAAQVGPQNVTLQVDDGRGSGAVQGYTVVVSAAMPDQPPVITSNPPLTAIAAALYQYPVAASDPEGKTVQFAIPVAPNGMSINPASGLVQWTPTTAQAGHNAAVTVSATDPAGNVAFQSFTLTVRQANRQPVINSQPVSAAAAGALYSYDVRANDPDSDPLNYQLDTAPTGMTIDALGRIRWSPAVADIGAHPVTLTVSDGFGGTVSQPFTLTVEADTQAPQVSVRVNPNRVSIGAPSTIVVSATDNVGVQTLGLTVNGMPVALGTNGQGTVTMNQAGIFHVVATATDAAGNSDRATAALLVFDPLVMGAPTVALPDLPNNGVITAPTDITGTVNDLNLLSYTLAVAPADGSGPFVTIGGGTMPVMNGVLAKLDPTMLANDNYILRLSATNTGGHTTTVDTPFSVMGDLKLGNFTLSFTDLSVPVSGIPITVTRTYDTLQANASSDFGFGWRLEYRDVHLRTSVPKTGDEANGIFNAFSDGTRVYVTLPGGKREGFTFKPVSQFIGGAFYQPNFDPDPGVTDKLTVPGEVSNAGPLGAFQNLAGQNGAISIFLQTDGTYTNDAGIPYNPADDLFGATYFVTTKDGTQYQIDASSGKLQSVTDRNGNTLSFTDAGISSSAGPAITFGRDPQGRIVSIADPMGQSIRYGYDSNGNLVAVTDRMNNMTKFVYRTDRPHYLDNIIDPLGRTGVKTTYDAQGRLTGLTDANGKTVQLTQNPGDSTETITDALGNPTTYQYDARGNIVTEVDALGGITQRTYDANNNLLSETDPLGHMTAFTYDSAGYVLTMTDPLGNITRSTFGAFGNALTNTDPLGNTTTNAYDGSGNLRSSTDPAGNVTRYTYDSAGNQTSITDVAGNVTRLGYDASGNETSRVDALGHMTAFSYDANGDQLTQTTTLTTPTGLRTLVTATAYNGNGEPITVTDAERHVTHIQYDGTGREIATSDALDRKTQFQYDARGNPLGILYPDGTTLTSAYDAAGHLIASTDRAGRTTHYEYDTLGRQVTTIYPDATPADLSDNPRTSTSYDAASRIIAQLDELGHQTQFQYDDAGRQIAMIDAMGNKTTEQYDAAGRKISETDPLGHTTRLIYDSLGNVSKTIFADGSSTSSTYDRLGREISRTDQDGHTTQYQYDPLGRLIGVMDALGQKTQYAYDEAGDLVSQQDANGHITRFEYDGLGQRTATVLPLGQRSVTAYDAVGNVASTTDFNGNTIQFNYDTNNRLIAKHSPGGTALMFTYTPLGQLATVSDTRGVTSYQYDERDRLLARTDPDGTKISYTYDLAGNRTSVAIPAGTTSYTFDSLNRLTTVTDPGNGVTHYTYDKAGNLTRTDLPNGTSETRNYDVLNRLTSVQNGGPSGAISTYQYTLDPAGNRTAVLEDTGRKVTYSYDADYRLTEEAIVDPATGNRTIDYTYDPAGNRLTRNDTAEGLTSYAYDANDRLLTETLGSAVTHYAYDDNGNTLSKIKNASDQVFMHWDVQNRLIGEDVTDATGIHHIQNKYDDSGIRVAQTVDGQETRYLVDANRPFAEVLEEYAPSGSVSVSYVYGVRLISQNRAATLSYYEADGLESTRSLTDASGNVTDRYVYDAFGRTIGQVGSTHNDYLFTGEQFDSNLQSYYLRARYYGPAAGRFLRQDSVPGDQRLPLSLHRFLYGNANPVNIIDPSGNQGEDASGINATLVNIAVPSYFRLINRARPLRMDIATGVEENSGWNEGNSSAALYEANRIMKSWFGIYLRETNTLSAGDVSNTLYTYKNRGRSDLPSEKTIVLFVTHIRGNALGEVYAIGGNIAEISYLAAGNPFGAGNTIAHELGHSLGLPHDMVDGPNNLMAPGSDFIQGRGSPFITLEQRRQARKFGLQHGRLTK